MLFVIPVILEHTKSIFLIIWGVHQTQVFCVPRWNTKAAALPWCALPLGNFMLPDQEMQRREREYVFSTILLRLNGETATNYSL